MFIVISPKLLVLPLPTDSTLILSKARLFNCSEIAVHRLGHQLENDIQPTGFGALPRILCWGMTSSGTTRVKLTMPIQPSNERNHIVLTSQWASSTGGFGT